MKSENENNPKFSNRVTSIAQFGFFIATNAKNKINYVVYYVVYFIYIIIQ